MTDPHFLTPAQVLILHERSLAEHGGRAGCRDPGGFESAVIQPQQDFFYAHADLFGIAAAYAYHIAEAQAFADGNKRTALAAALTFLELHGIDTAADQDALYAAMMGIATHELTKAGLADVFRGLFA